MNLEAGRSYITRNGRITEPIKLMNTNSTHWYEGDFVGSSSGEVEHAVWTQYGQYDTQTPEHELDIVEEYKHWGDKLTEALDKHEHDLVNHPPHYNQGGIECIDAIKSALTPEEYKGFLKGQVLKYTWRMNHKEVPKQDAKKAEWYLTRLIEELQ